MGPHISSLRPSLTFILVAGEPESSYGDFSRGRGKTVHTGWKLKGKKTNLRSMDAKDKVVVSCRSMRATQLHTKPLNHLNDVYCFLGHTVLVCKTWLSCLRSLTLSLLKTSLQPASLCSLRKGCQAACLLCSLLPRGTSVLAPAPV